MIFCFDIIIKPKFGTTPLQQKQNKKYTNKQL